ncbi:efflux RND transporter permease subunit [Pseudoalteromonas sp. S16_S37]|uniref:efflux RND transporter permease subunit n=1 Tax=Pseudoalteromonas sp. S16_S37 TaxID=2720228 RepID=UPI00168150DC|nr:efflux RND transporter permease subunit [Pseudoalteromonas sp. S16_S37]MBD1584874.1 efflux RND transporter permease subunit [Pseudoalteromonas sp. S16_S37]
MGFLIACICMYVLVASLFRSYSQGVIVLSTIPFCLAAAVVGHTLMGHTLTSNSMFGMVALSGIVINGTLVLTNKVNQLVANGLDHYTAIITASINRFRAIVLTSVTTTIGLLPMLMETSEQALFLVPFAIALTFGSITSTFIILYVIPCSHAISYKLRCKG